MNNLTSEYQSLVLNLNSQGAYASKSIELLSEMKDLIWQSKILLEEGNLNGADEKLEEAKVIAPKLTLDISFSLKVNKGRLALEEASSIIDNARKEGYDVKALENYYDSANSFFNTAKESYMKEEYDSIDSNIASVLDLTDKISSGIESLKYSSLKTGQSTVQPTGFTIANYPWLPYSLITVPIALVVLKISRRKKELRGISKLERIKSRL
jgi:hypothetical protein